MKSESDRQRYEREDSEFQPPAITAYANIRGVEIRWQGDRPVFRKGHVDLHIDLSGGPEFTQFVKRIRTIVKRPKQLEALLKSAVAHSIVENIRQRFVQNLPNALEMEAGKTLHHNGQMTDEQGKVLKRQQGMFNRNIDMQTGKSVVTNKRRQRNTDEMTHYQRLHSSLLSAHESGNLARINRSYRRIAAFKKRMVESLNRSAYDKHKQIISHPFSSGRFRPYALRVLELLTASNLMKTVSNSSGVSVSVGRKTLLDMIKTPSATEFVLKLGHTTSPYNVLWRHLEFGTGVHSTDPVGNKGTRFSMGKMWFYSNKRPWGMVLRGSQGIHALYNAHTGRAPEVDQEALSRAFYPAFERWISGKLG